MWVDRQLFESATRDSSIQKCSKLTRKCWLGDDPHGRLKYMFHKTPCMTMWSAFCAWYTISLLCNAAVVCATLTS